MPRPADLSVLVPQVVAVPWRRRGCAGWAALAAFVIAWDLVAPETLTDSFRRQHRGVHRFYGPATTVLWCYLTAHLFELLPLRYDPLDRVHEVIVVFRRPGALAA